MPDWRFDREARLPPVSESAPMERLQVHTRTRTHARTQAPKQEAQRQEKLVDGKHRSSAIHTSQPPSARLQDDARGARSRARSKRREAIQERTGQPCSRTCSVEASAARATSRARAASATPQQHGGSPSRPSRPPAVPPHALPVLPPPPHHPHRHPPRIGSAISAHLSPSQQHCALPRPSPRLFLPCVPRRTH